MLKFKKNRLLSSSALSMILLASLWLTSAGYLLLEKMQDTERFLNEQTSVQEASWKASLNLHKTGMQTYFDAYIMEPEVLGMLRVAKENETKARIARAQILRYLDPVYKDVFIKHDIQQLHFHTPEGRSFLRFHHPVRHGDDLAEVRASVRIVNTQLNPVQGFELGRVVSGFRNVFPIISKGEHLGSVELSQPLETFRDAMAKLDPRREYAFLINGPLLRSILFQDRMEFYRSSPIHPDWYFEETDRNLPHASPPLSDTALTLARDLGKNPDVLDAFERGKSSSFGIREDRGYYAVSFTAIHDIDHRLAAYLLSFVPAPELGAIKRRFMFNLSLITFLMFILALSVTRIINSREELSRERKRLQAITDTMAEGLYVEDAEGCVVSANRAVFSLLGFKTEELVGSVSHDLFHQHAFEGKNVSIDECRIISEVKAGKTFRGEEKFRRKDGTVIPVNVVSAPMYDKGLITGAVTVFSNITVRKKTEKRLRYLATTDELTGLPNRRHFMEALARELEAARRYGQNFSLIMMDIDHFKKINDRYGHVAGDHVLAYFGETLKKLLRTVDVPGRFGGEEFTVVLPSTDLDGAFNMAERLRAYFEEHFVVYENRKISFTLSFGVAEHNQEIKDEDELIKRADQALYQAKENGRNRVVRYD
jgi:diguanylate cyclase (GGDEF)-like protein/PAS domain S-box-containing protein